MRFLFWFVQLEMKTNFQTLGWFYICRSVVKLVWVAPYNIHPVSLAHHLTSPWYAGHTWSQCGSITPNSTPHLFYQCRRPKSLGLDPCVRRIPWRRKWQPTPVFLPEKSCGQRSLAGYSPRGCKESDTIE